MTTATLNDQWHTTPFTLNGFSFRSRVKIGSDTWYSVVTIPAFLFEDLNRSCLNDLIEGEWTRENLERELTRINENGSEAFIELVEESEA